MNKRTKSAIAALAIAPIIGLGFAWAVASSPSRAVTAGAGEKSHPECYNATKLNDPNDFCYQTIGPWNSTRSSDEEVRSLMSLERMVEFGLKVEEIQRYYPDYSPSSK
ncbi:hypothetical protein [Arthrobacter sp. LFS091]|uniref:hypothetical protein n=1 Tax=Arthrobacter sp. LFS091 TaxID=3229892 RepID=UPI003A7FF0EF